MCEWFALILFELGQHLFKTLIVHCLHVHWSIYYLLKKNELCVGEQDVLYADTNVYAWCNVPLFN